MKRFFLKIKSWSVICLITIAVSCSKDDSDSNNNETPPEKEEELADTPLDQEETMDTSTNQEETEEEETDTPETKYGNITWKNWYLSIPIDNGKDNKATSIYYDDIIGDKLTDEESNYFYKNEDGSYTMFTQFTGYSTSTGSPFGLNEGKYCRTELREYWQGIQDTNENWSMSEGTHILESTLKVENCDTSSLTNNCVIIIAQIHGKESPGIDGNPATVKLTWVNGDIWIDHYTKPDVGQAWSNSFDDKQKITQVDNEKFTIKVKIEDGKLFVGLKCEEKNVDFDYREIYDYVGNGYIHENYFKTGNYFIWDDDYLRTSQVILYDVITEHK